MKFTQTPLDGLIVIEPKVFTDERGFFLETFQDTRYRDFGINDNFKQDNQSRSFKGVIRGLHFQKRVPHAQIVTVLRGHILDVAVDIRPSSLTYGKWFGINLSDTGPRQIYMAPGFAHGFCVLSDWVDLHYKISGEYNPNDEGGIIWNDKDIGIKWPIVNPVISKKDAANVKLRDYEVDLSGE